MIRICLKSFLNCCKHLMLLKMISMAIFCIPLSHAQRYECISEMDGETKLCVFYGVRYFKNTTNTEFAFPTGISKPVNVAFKDCHMVRIPDEFLDVFRDGLKVLKVENCKLQSMTITRHMEAAYAANNAIDKVVMDQNNECSSLILLDMDSNELKKIQNIPICKELKVLNLSRNQKLWADSFDLSLFTKFKLLEVLNLSSNGVYYVDDPKNALQSLKILDLSKNNLLSADLRVPFFKSLSALEQLNLNGNNLDQLDYADLTGIKALKTVYLNGNNFPCETLKDMLQFLNHEHDIATPVDWHSKCGDQQLEGICCKGPLPTHASQPPSPTTPVPGTTIHAPSETTSTTVYVHSENLDDSSWKMWVIWGAVVIILAVLGIVFRYLSDLYSNNLKISHLWM